MKVEALAKRVICFVERTNYSIKYVAILDLNLILLNIQFRLIDLFLETSGGDHRKFSFL